MNSRKSKSLLTAILSFVLMGGHCVSVSAQDKQDTPLGTGNYVWVNADGNSHDYWNVRYQIDQNTVGGYQLYGDAYLIYLQDPQPHKIYAGYPYGSSATSDTTIDLSDQTDKELNKLDSWYATGEVSINDLSTDLVFRSQLAKISLEVDMSYYSGDIEYFSAQLNSVPTQYKCGPNYSEGIVSSQIPGVVDLKVENIEDNKYLIEGLLIPGSSGRFMIKFGEESWQTLFSEIFSENLSEGKVYSANLTYNSGNDERSKFSVSNSRSVDRSTFTAQFTAGFDLLGLYNVLPKTIAGVSVEMEQDGSLGTSVDTALKGKVTLPYEVEQISMSDVALTSTLPDYETITFGSNNEAVFNGSLLRGNMRLTSAADWSLLPIQLEAGMTQTVIIWLDYIDGSERYYSIDITRSSKQDSKISLSPDKLDFGVFKVGYNNVTGKSITIEYTGETSIVLKQPESTSAFDVSKLESTQLDPGQTVTLTITPRMGLAAGKYDETITINTTNGIEKAITVSVVINPSVEEQDSNELNHSSFATYDKNCDGVITCDERLGQGWMWSESEKTCVFSSKIGSTSTANSYGYSFVNTADK